MIFRAGVSRGKFAAFELGDCLSHGRRRRAEYLHALHGERAQDDTADAAAQDGVEIHVLLVARLRFAQGGSVNAARLVKKKGEETRLRQMRFDLRIEAFREFDGDAELHGAFSRKFGSVWILAPEQ